MIKNKTTCSTCGAGEYYGIDTRNAKAGPGSYLPRKPELFNKIKKLRSGELLSCLDCNSTWLLEDGRRVITLLPDSILELLYKWNEDKIVLPPELTQILRKIGYTSPSTNINGKPIKHYPCTVITNNNEIIDFALVCVQTDAPSNQSKSIRLASDIKSLSSSKFALPFDVRVATSRANEISMCFAPTAVALSNGVERILNGPSNFLKINGVVSSLTELITTSVYHQQEYRLNEEITYFIADELSD